MKKNRFSPVEKTFFFMFGVLFIAASIIIGLAGKIAKIRKYIFF